MSSGPYDLSPTEAGARLGVSPWTVKRWAAEGHLGALRTPGGQWRFRQQDLEEFLARQVVDGSAPSAPTEVTA